MFCSRCASEFDVWFNQGKLDICQYYLDQIDGIAKEEELFPNAEKSKNELMEKTRLKIGKGIEGF